VVKIKVAAPFRQAEFDIEYGEGISKTGEIIDLGVDHKLVIKSGVWYAYGDIRLGQGRKNSKRSRRPVRPVDYWLPPLPPPPPLPDLAGAWLPPADLAVLAEAGVLAGGFWSPISCATRLIDIMERPE
jgi:RecA C-terminal domain